MDKHNETSDVTSPDDDNTGDSSPEENNNTTSDAAAEPDQAENALDSDTEKPQKEQKKGFPWGKVIAGGAAVVGAIAGAIIIQKRSSRHGSSTTRVLSSARPRTNIPVSLDTFAAELVHGGKSYSAVVEANNPLSTELDDEDLKAIADAVAAEVLQRLKTDPQFRDVVREEATSLKNTLASNVLAGAVIKGITIALSVV